MANCKSWLLHFYILGDERVKYVILWVLFYTGDNIKRYTVLIMVYTLMKYIEIVCHGQPYLWQVKQERMEYHTPYVDW